MKGKCTSAGSGELCPNTPSSQEDTDFFHTCSKLQHQLPAPAQGLLREAAHSACKTQHTSQLQPHTHLCWHSSPAPRATPCPVFLENQHLPVCLQTWAAHGWVLHHFPSSNCTRMAPSRGAPSPYVGFREAEFGQPSSGQRKKCHLFLSLSSPRVNFTSPVSVLPEGWVAEMGGRCVWETACFPHLPLLYGALLHQHGATPPHRPPAAGLFLECTHCHLPEMGYPGAQAAPSSCLLLLGSVSRGPQLPPCLQSLLSHTPPASHHIPHLAFVPLHSIN